MIFFKKNILFVFCSFIFVGSLCLGLYFFLNLNRKQNDNTFKVGVGCDFRFGFDRNVCEFLNFKSPYTAVDIESMILSSTRTRVKITKLGLESPSRIESVLLGYKEIDGNILLLMGFDDKNKGRFVAPCKIPLYTINDKESPVSFAINGTKNKSLLDAKYETKLKSVDEIKSSLNSLIGKVIVLMTMDDEISQDSVKSVSYSESAVRLSKEINEQVSLTRTLIGRVNGNGLDSEYSSYNENIKLIEGINDDLGVNLRFPIILSIIVNMEK